MRHSRRSFLRKTCAAACGAGLVSSLENLSLLSALAQTSASDYKALVCVFLNGGNDGNNTVVPREPAEYAAYAATRRELAIPRDRLLSIRPPSAGGVEFGFHPSCKGMQTLFNAGKLAVVSNVGTLVEPVTRAQYQARTARLPDNLFSHSDQVVQWQAAISENTNATKMNGWGARVADKVAGLNAGASLPLMVSYAGGVFLTGGQEQPYAPFVLLSPFFFGDSQNDVAVAKEYTQKIVGTDANSHAARAANRTLRDGVFYADNMNTLVRLPTTFTWPSQDAFSLSTFFPIAKMIAERQRFGLKRQVFFLRLDGFDHHTNQLGSHAQLLSLVSAGLHDFYAATEQLGVASQVTTFVLSDFGRTYKPAAGAGSDHAWGNHLFVAGGAVRGGDFYGKLPTPALGGPDDADGNGRWIPTISVEQYAATLAAWFGLGPDEIREVFPNLGRFDKPNLGFLG
ncbi:MAG TPA: DUF1501 domain-containing protein [Pyrinomonadaceae bacterium]|nr:DUF1501 domain-containing protein [Pyrinomonadaceae bacterium]